jgi:GNAT superfamily N-acetyltransferase
LFVQAELRGADIDRRLMRKSEEEACRRGCSGAWLDTYSFQARDFYRFLDTMNACYSVGWALSGAHLLNRAAMPEAALSSANT